MGMGINSSRGSSCSLLVIRKEKESGGVLHDKTEIAVLVGEIFPLFLWLL
jgi:hypothetical protein